MNIMRPEPTTPIASTLTNESVVQMEMKRRVNSGKFNKGSISNDNSPITKNGLNSNSKANNNYSNNNHNNNNNSTKNPPNVFFSLEDEDTLSSSFSSKSSNNQTATVQKQPPEYGMPPKPVYKQQRSFQKSSKEKNQSNNFPRKQRPH